MTNAVCQRDEGLQRAGNFCKALNEIGARGFDPLPDGDLFVLFQELALDRKSVV